MNFKKIADTSFNLKGLLSYPCSGNLRERRTSFSIGLIFIKFCRFSVMFLTGFNSFDVLLLISLSITIVLFVEGFWCHLVWDRWGSLNNVFIYGDFCVHRKDWLTYSGGTDRSGKICYNFCISNDLNQINFPTWILDFDSHRPSLLYLYLSCDPSICSTAAFFPLENSDQVVVSVSINVPSKRNVNQKLTTNMRSSLTN